jgi:hypothetical protein
MCGNNNTLEQRFPNCEARLPWEAQAFGRGGASRVVNIDIFESTIILLKCYNYSKQIFQTDEKKKIINQITL